MRIVFVCALLFVLGFSAAAQGTADLKQFEAKNLDLGFCPAPCIAGHTPDLAFVYSLLLKFASPKTVIEVDSRAGTIVFRDSRERNEKVDKILHGIDDLVQTPRSSAECKNKRSAKILFGEPES